MKKYINLLLAGLLIFVLGLIISNFELGKFELVDTLPDNFELLVEKLSIQIDEDKEYELIKDKYNQNINIEKVIDNSLENEVLIEIEHAKTSVVLNTMRTIDDEVKVVFSNEFVFDRNDVMDIVDLGLKSLKEKRIYNYRLLKYSNIKVYGSEESLKKIEI